MYFAHRWLVLYEAPRSLDLRRQREVCLLGKITITKILVLQAPSERHASWQRHLRQYL